MHDFQSDIDKVQSIDAVPRILEVICRTTGMGLSAIARVTENRWVCCAARDEIDFGLVPGGELKVEPTICDEIRQSGEPVVIDEVNSHKEYRGHPNPAMYGFQSYISIPIFLRDRGFFGTLCAIDPRPAKFDNPQTVEMLRLFAELIATHLGALDQKTQSEASLAGERNDAELREQFIAILGHDLRNPLASIQAGIRLARRAKDREEVAKIFDMMQNSVLRMAKLVDNVMDLTRGRLGGGVPLHLSRVDLKPVLQQVIAELKAVHPASEIASAITLHAPVRCDSARIGQLFSNLLSNALTHGERGKPIEATAKDGGGVFELSVANAGEPLSDEALGNTFKPFRKGQSGEGLGLGLYICSEIAKAHGGTLTVTSTPAETRFTFRMPLEQAEPR